jgi:hypothetical protein
MKVSCYLISGFMACMFLFTSCVKEEPLQTKGEINAELIKKIIADSNIKWVTIYEFSPSAGNWVLAADNQSWSPEMELIRIEKTFFYLNGTGNKSYVAPNIPTHQLSGFYYFNLEYLVSFELSSNKENLYLYFRY